jgi:hypothetical protein
VAGGWRRLHNEEFLDLHASPYIVRVIKLRRVRWVGHVACIIEMRNSHKILAVRPEGKLPLRRPRCRGEHNVRQDLKEIEWEDVDWILLTCDRDQWQTREHLNKPLCSIRWGTY